MGRRELSEIFLAPFKKAVAAGATGLMSSYNEIDGVPTSGDHWLLTELLREDWGFDGYITADFGAINNLQGAHGVSDSPGDSVRQFIEAGGNMDGHDFGDFGYEEIIIDIVNNGTLAMEDLDRAVTEILLLKHRLGLIDSRDTTMVDVSLVERNLGNNVDHVEVAKRASDESIVLLNNANADLPLDVSNLKQIAVIGPNGDEARAGDYSAAGWAGGAPNGGGNINNANTITVLEAVKKLKDVNEDLSVVQSVGSSITGTANFFSVVQRHSLSVAEDFEPNAPSVPYDAVEGDENLGGVEAGTQGLKAEYVASEPPSEII